MLVGQQAEQPPLRVLLLGNCASLPLIQSSVSEAFGAEGQTVVFDRKNRKKACLCYSRQYHDHDLELHTYYPLRLLF